MYDRGCPQCGEQIIDCLEPIDAPDVLCPECRVPTKRIWLGQAVGVISDEIDLTTKHIDGKERRFTSRAELNRALSQRGLMPAVRHVGERGGDKSPHTSRWV